MSAKDASTLVRDATRHHVVTGCVPAYFKALFFCSAAAELLSLGHVVPSVILFYGGLFQLGVSILLWHAFIAPEMVGIKDILLKVDKGGIGESEDPAKSIGHKDVKRFLTELRKTHGFLGKFADAFEELQNMRNFVHYGPRLRRVAGDYVFVASEFNAPKLRRRLEGHVKEAERYFRLYYRAVETISSGQSLFLHLPEYEDAFVKLLCLHYPAKVGRTARLLHAKLSVLVPEEMWKGIRKCRCIHVEI